MKVGNYEQMMSHLKDPFNPSELRARVKELEQEETFESRMGFDNGSKPYTSVKNHSSFQKITMGKHKGKYRLILGSRKNKKTYYGTITELQKIFDDKAFVNPGNFKLRDTSTLGGDTKPKNLENKKYPKNYLPTNKFIKFLKKKGIDIKKPGPFAKNYGIDTQTNPYWKSGNIYDISKFNDQSFVDDIIKRQVKTGRGTEKQKIKFRIGDQGKILTQKKRKKSLVETDPTKAKGTEKFNYHHIRQIVGGVPLTTDDVVIINQRLNSSLQDYNKTLNRIADAIRNNNRLALESMNAKNEGAALDYMKRVDELNESAEKIVNSAIDKLPKKYKGYVGFNQFTLPTDEYGLPISNEPMIIRKVGGMPISKDAIDLTNLSLKDEEKFRKIVLEQAKAGKTGKIQNLKNIEEYGKNRKQTKDYIYRQFCPIGKANGGRIGFANGPRCTPDDVVQGMKRAIQQGDSAKVLRALRVGKNLLGYVVAPADVAIETAFALPHLLEGDLEGAKQATIVGGLFGWGKDLQEQVGNRFGTNSPAYGSLERQRAIDLQVEGMFEMDKALEFGEKAGVFTKKEDGDYIKNSNLSVSQIDSFKNSVQQFERGAKKSIEARKLFADARPKITGPQNESTALSQLSVFSDELRSGTLDEKIGDPGIISNLFKSLNISKPAERTVEGFLSTAGRTEYPLASKVKESELIRKELNRLGELRPADLPLDIAAQVPAYEKSLMPSEEETEKRFRRNLGEADPKLVEQYEQMGFSQLTPFLPSYANGGRINFANGGRLTFSDGSPKDPSKRKFLQKTAIGGGVAGGLATGLINLLDLFRGGSKVTKTTEAVQRASRAEEIFFDLVRNVKNKGVMREARFTGDEPGGVIYEHAGVKVIDDEPYTRVEFQTDKGAPAVIEYRKPGYDVDPNTETTIKDPGGFEYEGQEVGRIRPNGDVDIDFEEEIIDEITNVEKIAKGE